MNKQTVEAFMQLAKEGVDIRHLVEEMDFLKRGDSLFISKSKGGNGFDIISFRSGRVWANNIGQDVVTAKLESGNYKTYDNPPMANLFEAITQKGFVVVKVDTFPFFSLMYEGKTPEQVKTYIQEQESKSDCPLCGAVNKDHAAMVAHLQEAHGVNEEEIFEEGDTDMAIDDNELFEKCGGKRKCKQDEVCPECGEEPCVCEAVEEGTVDEKCKSKGKKCGGKQDEDLYECPECGEMVSYEDEECPYCGAYLGDEGEAEGEEEGEYTDEYEYEEGVEQEDTLTEEEIASLDEEADTRLSVYEDALGSLIDDLRVASQMEMDEEVSESRVNSLEGYFKWALNKVHGLFEAGAAAEKAAAAPPAAEKGAAPVKKGPKVVKKGVKGKKQKGQRLAAGGSRQFGPPKAVPGRKWQKVPGTNLFMLLPKLKNPKKFAYRWNAEAKGFDVTTRDVAAYRKMVMRLKRAGRKARTSASKMRAARTRAMHKKEEQVTPAPAQARIQEQVQTPTPTPTPAPAAPKPPTPQQQQAQQARLLEERLRGKK